MPEMSTVPLEDSSFLGLEGLHVFVTGAAGETQYSGWRIKRRLTMM
jgi:hypothetical protein